MKIINLTIDTFRVINNLNINFNKMQMINVFIGNNGSGKSTLLEIIALIFRKFYMGKYSKETDFTYAIEYEIKETNVKITFNSKSSPKYSYFVNDIKSSSDGIQNYLPDNIFAYYSGSNTKMEQIFKKAEDDFKNKIKDGADMYLRKMFYIKQEHLKILFMSLWLSKDKTKSSLLKNILNIKSLSKLNIKLKNHKKWSKDEKDKYWGGKGETFKKWIDTMFNTSVTPYLGFDTMVFNIDVSKFIPMVDEPIDIIFANFESLLAYELLEDIELELVLKDEIKLNFNDLSEGEKQLILSVGFIGANRETNSLFLYDEADTYLHPKWQREIINEIEKIKIKGQVFMTTHSPLVLSEVKNNLFILEKGIIKQQEESSFYYDINTILEETMNVNRYPDEISSVEKQFYENILNSEVDKAKETLNSLKTILRTSGKDEEDHELVLELSGMIYRMELLGYEENNQTTVSN